MNHNVALTGFQFDLWNNPEFLTEAKKNHRHSSKNINYILLGCGVEILFLLSAQRSGVAWLATQPHYQPCLTGQDLINIFNLINVQNIISSPI